MRAQGQNEGARRIITRPGRCADYGVVGRSAHELRRQAASQDAEGRLYRAKSYLRAAEYLLLDPRGSVANLRPLRHHAGNGSELIISRQPSVLGLGGRC